MTSTEARHYLKWSRISFKKNKVLILYIYPSRPLFNCLGHSETESEMVFQNVIREAVDQLMIEAQLSMKWVAAVNANHRQPFGMVIIPKLIFDDETWQFKLVKNCFPKPFLERDAPESDKYKSYRENIYGNIF